VDGAPWLATDSDAGRSLAALYVKPENRIDPVTREKCTGVEFVNVVAAADAGVNIIDPDTDAGAYFLCAAAISVPFMALFFISTIYFMIYGLVRLGCCICGNGCCPKPHPDGYTAKARRWVQYGLSFFVLLTCVGAFLLIASGAIIPKGLGTGDTGLVGVTVAGANKMIGFGADMINTLSSAIATGGSVELAQSYLVAGITANGASSGGLDTSALQDSVDVASEALTAFEVVLEASAAVLDGNSSLLDDWMKKFTIWCVVTAVIGLVSILLAYALTMYAVKWAAIVGFCVTPFFTFVCFFMAGIGAVLSIFVQDLCIESQKFSDVFLYKEPYNLCKPNPTEADLSACPTKYCPTAADYDPTLEVPSFCLEGGPSAAAETPIAAGLLPCLEPEDIQVLVKPLYETGNTGIYLHWWARALDNAVGGTESAGALCYRYDPTCVVDIDYVTPTDELPSAAYEGYNIAVECSAKCNIGTTAALGTAAANPSGVSQTTLWTNVLGPEPGLDEITAYVESLGMDDSNFKNSAIQSALLVSQIGGIIGNQEKNVEYFNRCGQVEDIVTNINAESCPTMIDGFNLFAMGFLVGGIGFFASALMYTWAYQRLPLENSQEAVQRARAAQEGDKEPSSDSGLEDPEVGVDDGAKELMADYEDGGGDGGDGGGGGAD